MDVDLGSSSTEVPVVDDVRAPRSKRRLVYAKPSAGVSTHVLNREIGGLSHRSLPTHTFVRDFQCSSSHDFGTEDELVPPLVVAYSRCSSTLAAAGQGGEIQLIDARLHKDERTAWIGHTDSIFDVKWIDVDSKMITASGDKSCKLWDLEKQQLLTTFQAHQASVKSISPQNANNFIFATGARDGAVFLWDARVPVGPNNKNAPVRQVLHAHPAQKRPYRRNSPSFEITQSVTSVLFSKDDRMILSAGAADGVIKFWDIRKFGGPTKASSGEALKLPLEANGNRRHGFSSLAFNSTGSQLIANSLDNNVYLFDSIWAERCDPVLYSVPISSFYVKSVFSPDDKYILSGSSDTKVYLWQIGQTKPIVHLEGHWGEVSAVDWNPSDYGQIASCADDGTIQTWDIVRGASSSVYWDDSCKGHMPMVRPKGLVPRGVKTVVQSNIMKYLLRPQSPPKHIVI